MNLDSYLRLVCFLPECYRSTRAALVEPAFRAAFDKRLTLPADDAVAFALRT